MNPFSSSNIILTTAITTAFIAIFHPCFAEPLTEIPTDLETRGCERALHQEAVHFLSFHDLKNRHKSGVVLLKKPSISFCVNADRKSLTFFKDFVARIQAKKITNHFLKSAVCEKVVDDLVKFAKRCIRYQQGSRLGGDLR